MIMNSSFFPKDSDKTNNWRVVDAEGKVVGRVAAEVAAMLRGKDKPSFTPHAMMGDYVVVINADKVVFTGDKWDQKIYVRHSRYPGGLTETKAKDVLRKFPERLVEHAVFGMLPKGNLGNLIRKRLRVYAGSTHPHIAQV